MYTRNRFPLFDILKWTRRVLFFLIIYTSIMCYLYVALEWEFIDIPWTPIALVGTAVAFMIGFQSNAAYDRIWEARKIWGGIVNTSRTWGMMTKSYVSNHHLKHALESSNIQAIRTRLIYRHIAWMTALRYAMRVPKKWENLDKMKTNQEWNNLIYVPEREENMQEVLQRYLSPSEIQYLQNKGNKATALLYLQSKDISELKNKDVIWEFSYLELENILKELFTLQGQSERIKNFPYPRHFSSLTFYFTWILILLLPIGLIPEFSNIGLRIDETCPMVGKYFVWVAIPFCVVVSWIFHTMMRVSMTSDNPFEGTVNDVPISAISRGIEIDLREMLDESKDQIPQQYKEVKDVQV